MKAKYQYQRQVDILKKDKQLLAAIWDYMGGTPNDAMIYSKRVLKDLKDFTDAFTDKELCDMRARAAISVALQKKAVRADIHTQFALLIGIGKRSIKSAIKSLAGDYGCEEEDLKFLTEVK